MKFETLKSFNKKKLIIPIVIISCLIIVITIFVSQAKYISKDSITIINDEVNYKPYDFKIIGIYQQKDNCTNTNSDDCYESKKVIPTKGYEINKDKTYCFVEDENEKITNKIYTDEDGQHVIGALNIRSKCYLYFDKIKPASEKTFDQLKNLVPELKNQGVIDENGFTSGETAQSVGIVYETEDNDGKSYYYRGDIQDNYVKFGKMGTDPNSGDDIWWRIIRINGDGSIRIMFAGIGDNVPDQKDRSKVMINNGQTYKFSVDGNYGSYYYVGYQYQGGKRNGRTTDSNVKTALELWFERNLKDEFDLEDSKIDKNAGYCGDRQIYDDNFQLSNNVSQYRIYYGAYIRNDLNTHPSYICPDEANDLFTMQGATKGSKSLLYPIGLITADEVTYAGGTYAANGMYSESSWTISPYDYWTLSAKVFIVDVHGKLSHVPLDDSRIGLRPVINLVSGSLISGNGTAENPFKTVNE